MEGAKKGSSGTNTSQDSPAEPSTETPGPAPTLVAPPPAANTGTTPTISGQNPNQKIIRKSIVVVRRQQAFPRPTFMATSPTLIPIPVCGSCGGVSPCPPIECPEEENLGEEDLDEAATELADEDGEDEGGGHATAAVDDADETDSDGDGIVDSLDPCPDDQPAVGADTDNDGCTDSDQTLAPPPEPASELETTITQKPETENHNFEVKLEFTCNQGTCTFECSADNTNWTVCTSPHTLTDQREGDRKYFVRAKAGEKMDSTPAEISWINRFYGFGWARTFPEPENSNTVMIVAGDETYVYSQPTIAKIDSTGTTIWSKAFPTDDENLKGPYINQMAVAPSGNLILVGIAANQVAIDFDKNIIDGHAGGIAFFMELSTNDGSLVRSMVLDDATPTGEKNSEITNIGFDLENNMILAGTFYCNADFGKLAGPSYTDEKQTTQNCNADNGNFDIFLTKINADGTYGWTQVLGAPFFERNASLKVGQDGNIFLSYTSHNEEGAAGFDNLSYAIVQISASGELNWSHRIDSKNLTLNLTGYTIDTENRLIAFGNYLGTTRFNLDGVDASEDKTAIAENGAAFVTSFDRLGKQQWMKFIDVKNTATKSIVKAVQVITDASNNIYVSGYFSGEIDFAGTGSDLRNSETDASFIQKLDSTGSHLWVKTFVDQGHHRGKNLQLDKWGQLRLTYLIKPHGETNDKIVFTTLSPKDGEILSNREIAGSGNFIVTQIKQSLLTPDSHRVTMGIMRGSADFDFGDGSVILGDTAAPDNLTYFITRINALF